MFKRRAAARRAAAADPNPSEAAAPSAADSNASYVDLSRLEPNQWQIPRLFIALLAFCALQAAGLVLFSNGFLLTRVELPARNNCSSYLPSPSRSGAPPPTCWHKPRFRRAALILIDALRFDFAVYNETLAAGDPALVPHYRNKLPIINTVLRDSPDHGLLFRVRADPPTTTLQRLKALTTGTLPTFVDAGSNFFGQVVAEDNVVQQLTGSGRRVVFMGDDTWEAMYPGAMNESYPYPSLEVWDLHTVDEGILEHLQPVLKRDPKNWDLLIAHFLGVDHAGHRYGPSHPAMAAKLEQLNGVLADVFAQVDDDTVVFVIGDHGMDPKGDHGGDSEDEINAGLFVYSKRPLLGASGRAALDAVIEGTRSIDFGSDDPFVALDGHRTMPQIDFIPTLSMLLGIPVPFGNLGTVIPELFLVSEADAARNLLEVTRANAHQVHAYLGAYSALRMAARLSMDELTALFRAAEDAFAAVVVNPGKGPAEQRTRFTAAYLRYVHFTRRAYVSARNMWARFDLPLIAMGAAVLVLSLVALPVYTVLHWPLTVPLPYISTIASGVAGGAVGTLGLVADAVAVVDAHGDSALTNVHEVTFGAATGLTTGYLVASAFQVLRLSRATSSGPFAWNIFSPNALLATLLLALHAAVPASDSFTIHEDAVTGYLLQAFGVVTLARAMTIRNSQARDSLVKITLGFMVLTRLSLVSTICREEQAPHCTPTFYASATSSVAAPQALVFLAAIVPVVVLAVRAVLFDSDNIQGAGSVVSGFMLPIGLLISVLYWSLDAIENRRAWPGWEPTLAFTKMWVAKVGFLASSTASILFWSTDPNCLGIDVINSPTAPGPALVSGTGTRQLIIVGLPNAVGASYFVFLSIAFMVLAMFQKPAGAIALSLGFMQIMLLVEMGHLWPLLPLHLAVLTLISARLFFATGHQATLSSIQWDVGHIGLDSLSWTLSPLIVALNTFAGPILAALAAPLLGIWKRPVLSRSIKAAGTSVGVAVLTYVWMRALGLAIAVLAAGGFRRHLMVWRVFAPKFLFEAGGFVATMVVIVWVGVGAVWAPVWGLAKFLEQMRAMGVIK
ncbi:hypothetical protein BDK51DRAFT_19374 [Blyttiomyces helicus]|uniref:GPI ethanolamine phosphate transferase 2 C-terminal domain-containing protein n=1 Tax=Blyttiomyces helicus TaxID=388810 RepID=A0A4P9WJZ1_9FUNG|nr:hypothetical protein BDK51DRAFT_19374 [Blyttiomyces helicus]|eukprot:RKO93104.1 hypothetical protein BDK51DRAFT_19374 [Blyttiomyces helicus]